MNDDEFKALIEKSRKSVETMTALARQTRERLEEAERRRRLLTETHDPSRESGRLCKGASDESMDQGSFQ